MNNCCLVCNTQDGLYMRHASNFFGAHNTLHTGHVLSKVLSGILDKNLTEDKVHTKLLCKKCLKSCSDYDSLQTRLDALKSEMLDQFKKSLSTNNMEYDKYESYTQNAPSKPSGKRVVLSASKLQPLPPDMLLNVSKLPLANTNLTKPTKTSSMLNLKVTVGSSVLTQTIKTTASSITDTELNPSPLTLPDPLSTIMKVEQQEDDDTKPVVQSTEEPSIIISEDCSLSVIPGSNSQDGNLVFQMDAIKRNTTLSNSLTEFINVSAPSIVGDDEDSQRYVFSNLEILQAEDDDDDEDAQTIVFDGENGSILRMMNGQKLIYQDGEISIVLPDDDMETGDQDADNAQDSNDESQIELQVSGDEETANAIIAAAKEQGGALIKVGSGEMFRVKSVQSNTEAIPLNIVQRDGKDFKCLMCENDPIEEKGPFVGNADALMQHLKSAHDARIYICQVCGAVMRKRSEYATHIAEHAQKLKSISKANIHECSTCGKSYNSRTLLAEHLNTHTGARPYACEHCNKTFASKYTLQAHIKTHTERPRPYKCTQCGKAFLTQQNLNQHEKTHSGVKNFLCNVCNKAFSTQHNLEVHAVVHSGHKPFVCTVCGKGFARRAELRDHARIHTGERPFECEQCGARFAQRSNLHSHRRATHLADRRYHCDHCPKRFKRRRLLEYHIKGTHTGERPLRCEICHASFVYPEHYRKHIRIHTGERPFVCEICGKSFNSRDNRNMHRFVHSDKKPYECLRCGAGYMRKQMLYAHIHASGHLAESIVVNQPRVSAPEDDSQAAINELGQVSSEEIEIHEIDDPGSNELVEVTESDIIESVDAEQLRDLTQHAQIEDGEGSVMQLIPVKLSDGNSGWVALRR